MWNWWEDNDNRYYDDDLILYRLGDILLLKAEALAAKGEIDAAITELNKTRKRAGIGDYEGFRDQESVGKEILRERWRELNGELKRSGGISSAFTRAVRSTSTMKCPIWKGKLATCFTFPSIRPSSISIR